MKKPTKSSGIKRAGKARKPTRAKAAVKKTLKKKVAKAWKKVVHKKTGSRVKAPPGIRPPRGKR